MSMSKLGKLKIIVLSKYKEGENVSIYKNRFLMAASTRSRTKNIFKKVLREEMRETNKTNTVSLNISNFIDTLDTQELENENERAYGDLMQTLELEVYRVVSNTKSLEFDLCT